MAGVKWPGVGWQADGHAPPLDRPPVASTWFGLPWGSVRVGRLALGLIRGAENAVDALDHPITGFDVGLDELGRTDRQLAAGRLDPD